MGEGLVPSVKDTSYENRMTYRATRSPWGFLDFLLFRIKDDALMRPPRRLENNDELSRTLVMIYLYDLFPEHSPRTGPLHCYINEAPCR